MNNDRFIAIEKELVKLRAEVADVRDAIKLESDSATKEFRIIYATLDSIKYRTLPEFERVRGQINGILNSADPSDDSDKSS